MTEVSIHSGDKSIESKLVKGRNKRRKSEKSCDRDALVSLRRLKIQENLLETAATKALEDQDHKSHLQTLSIKRKKDFDELKKSFHSAKTLFDKLKYNVTSLEQVSVKDIEQYKKIAIELDEKIINFKKFLDRELNGLRKKETQLNTEIQEAEINMKEINTKLLVKPYTEIVPSSVKSLRNTPSTCPEVEGFRAFLESSGGHRGGWGDQEHSSFVSQWKRLARTSPEAAHGGNAPYLEQLTAALVERIPGLTGEEVARHERWYREYARLKGAQQAALDEWRRSRMPLQRLRGSVDESQLKLALLAGLTGEEVARHERWYREYARLKGAQQAALDEWRRSRMPLQRLRGSVDESQLKLALLAGLTGEEVARHERWYREYARLKGAQQAALDEWRRNRMLLKQLRGTVEESQDSASNGEVSGTVEKAKKRKPTAGSSKPFAMKEIETEAKRLERRIVELKDYLPNKMKQEATLSLPSELEKEAASTANGSVRKTERPCHRIAQKEPSNRGVMDSWKSGRDGTELSLSGLQRSQGRARVTSPAAAEDGTGGDAHYAAPTKLWTLRKSQASSGGVEPNDFRLHIPMANSPKLRVSDWRRCLVGETHR